MCVLLLTENPACKPTTTCKPGRRRYKKKNLEHTTKDSAAPPAGNTQVPTHAGKHTCRNVTPGHAPQVAWSLQQPWLRILFSL
eukprot:1034201-Rhodomonas_salina.1